MPDSPSPTPSDLAARRATLIVLVWNRWGLTQRCLDTLRETNLEGADVMVVDNGSTDETSERLRDYESWIEVIASSENLGFVRGNNLGIEATPVENDIVLLNNDLVFTQEDWLQRLRACAHSDRENGIVGCRLLDSDGRLLHAGTFIPPETMWGQQIGANERNFDQYSRNRTVEGIVFACAFIRREVIEAIGGLALDFQSYFEDTDYCLRARQAGFRTILCGGVTIDHHEHGSTQGDTGALMKIFQGSRKVFEKKWKEDLLARYRHDILWQSILNFPTGYAMSSREILLALEERGVRSTYRYVYGPKTPFPPEEPEDTGVYRLNLCRSRPVPRRPPYAVVYGQGDVFYRNQGGFKVGFTMLEVDGFPEEWVRQANRMDEIWVPSEFNREGMQRCGVKTPIFKIPLGVNIDYFHPGIRAIPNPMGEFVFLSIFEWGERKNSEMLLGVFNDEFCADEPVRLVCKTMNRDPSISLRNEVARLRLKPSGGRISYIINREFPHYQLGALYRSADAFVVTSRGEGWNMPLMEAMACGLPTIATDWGAHTEYLNERIAYPLRIRGTVPAMAKCPYYTGFSWADPDPEHLRHLMREIFENQEQARQRGSSAALEMARKWTWDNTARLIEERLESRTE